MNKDFPYYLKSLDGTSFQEIREDGWVSIEKIKIKFHNRIDFNITKSDEIIRRSVDPNDWKNVPEYQSTKEEFDAIKFEFLNWIDINLKR